MRCPLCQKSESIIAHTGTHRLGDEEIFQRTRVCLACGLTYEDASPDQDWGALYGDLWKRGVEKEGFHDALYDWDLRWIGPGRGRRVFEVGCGAGYLLDRLASSGWRTAGCEPEEAVAQSARAKGHAITSALFHAAPEHASDLVVLGDVLEHSPRPLEMLATARAILRPGGRLYLRVPDLVRVNYESFGDVFGLQHRVWFTAETLVGALGLAGFRVERLQAHDAGMNVTATLAAPVPFQRSRHEPERSLAIVRTYSRDLAQRRQRIASELTRLEGKRVALWGGGEHASELLRFTELGRLATRVVDRNPSLWNTRLLELLIESPERLFDEPPEAVVIASKAYQDAIARELEPLAARGVEVVRLYAQGGHA